MEFWSTVTFRTDDNEEQSALNELMRQIGEQNSQLVEIIYQGSAVVVQPSQAHDLAESLQRLCIEDDHIDMMRRGIIAALAFNQHYVHTHKHGWNPVEVARRHQHD